MKLKLDQNVDLESSMVISGTSGLPYFFGKEKDGSEDDNVGSMATKRTRFVKTYDYLKLGTKLKMLRPEKKKGKWFSCMN